MTTKPQSNDQNEVQLDFPDLDIFKPADDLANQESLDSVNLIDDDSLYEHSADAYAKENALHYSDEEDINESENEVTEEENKKKLKFREILSAPLPTPLQRRAFKQYFMALAVLLFCVFMSIYYSDPRYLIGIVISVALVYLGITTTLDYLDGNIVEVPLLCSSVSETKFKNRTNVTFRTNEDIPKYFQFIIPGRQAKNFQLNALYVVYFDPRHDKVLLAYTEL